MHAVVSRNIMGASIRSARVGCKLSWAGKNHPRGFFTPNSSGARDIP